ncbi:MAG: ribokinase [Chloroflexi bacterium]|nr:ribokinase [Chloroflexota bacterium]
MTHIDYLAIGHISQDLTADGPTVGGTVSFSGRLAQAMGCCTAVLTSSGADFAWQPYLAGIHLHTIPAAQTTTFENVYTANGRMQTLHAQAAPLLPGHVPADWQRPDIVHLAPIANEIDPAMIHLFSNSLVGLTPQGWMRRWGADGRVYATDWPDAREFLPLAAAVILSHEDLRDEAQLAQYRAWSHLLVVTKGYDGCTIYFEDEIRHIPARRALEVNATGAGDIFATAFLIRLHQTGGNPWEAGRFANDIAACSVELDGLEAKLAGIQALSKTLRVSENRQG